LIRDCFQKSIENLNFIRFMTLKVAPSFFYRGYWPIRLSFWVLYFNSLKLMGRTMLLRRIGARSYILKPIPLETTDYDGQWMDLKLHFLIMLYFYSH